MDVICILLNYVMYSYVIKCGLSRYTIVSGFSNDNTADIPIDRKVLNNAEGMGQRHYR